MASTLTKVQLDRLYDASKTLTQIYMTLTENLVSAGPDGQRAIDLVSKANLSLGAELRNRDGVIRPTDRSKSFSKE